MFESHNDCDGQITYRESSRRPKRVRLLLGRAGLRGLQMTPPLLALANNGQAEASNDVISYYANFYVMIVTQPVLGTF